MTRSAVVDEGEQGERALQRYATKRMTNSYEISFREVDGYTMRRAAE